jgi:hypothetical protein
MRSSWAELDGGWEVMRDRHGNIVPDALAHYRLGQYEAVCRASGIDADLLPEVTDVDLKELGVPPGHPKRLLRAISGLAVAETSRRPPRAFGR